MTGAETFLSSADAYERHVGRYGAWLAERCRTSPSVEPGMRALDVGCGTGRLTAVLAERLGPASVSAADPSEPFRVGARRHGGEPPPPTSPISIRIPPARMAP